MESEASVKREMARWCDGAMSMTPWCDNDDAIDDVIVIRYDGDDAIGRFALSRYRL